MAITYHVKSNVFQLDGKDFTYLIGVYDNKFLTTLYYGKKIEIFGKSKTEETAKKEGLELVARVPFNPQIASLADAGEIYDHPLHPYSQSLLSAVPIPDPRREKNRKRIPYEPGEYDPSATLREVLPGHWVYCSESEGEKWKNGNSTGF